MRKKKKISLLPRMAVNNIRRNKSAYFPYIGVSCFAMFTYFVFDLILKNDIMYTLPRGVYALVLITIGFWLLGIIMIPFLYYTNSFLIKRRKRELGLYSILGLEKKHIGVMMFCEGVIVYGIVMTASIAMGLLFSRLLFLLLLNLAKMPVNVKFSVSPGAVADALAFYAIVSALNLFVNLVQVGKANPVELTGDSRRGEKQPKHIGLWGILGFLALGWGYYIAVTSEANSKVFLDFFGAVFLVVLGTYLLFTSGSIAFLRLLKRKKSLYYRADNFITVSGMLSRMRKNAAGLSNICIFSTMAIITVVCTVTVYLGMESILTYDYGSLFTVSFVGEDRADSGMLRAEAERLAGESGATIQTELDYTYVEVIAWQRENALLTGGEAAGQEAQDMRVKLLSLEDYRHMEGNDAQLQPGEVLVFSTGPDYGYGDVRIGERTYRVREELQSSRIDKKAKLNRFTCYYMLVFASREELEQACAVYGLNAAESAVWTYELNPEGDEEALDRFACAMNDYLQTQPGFAQFQDFREERSVAESMYGGLLFIGIFFGAIFLICLLVIMYYKQITEGFEDQKNFEIMQKVGLSGEEIRRAIKKQVGLVFGLPLAGAILHTAVGMKMVCMLLAAVGLYEVELLAVCTAVGCLMFAAVYGLCYRRTSAAYYNIVRPMS